MVNFYLVARDCWFCHAWIPQAKNRREKPLCFSWNFITQISTWDGRKKSEFLQKNFFIFANFLSTLFRCNLHTMTFTNLKTAIWWILANIYCSITTVAIMTENISIATQKFHVAFCSHHPPHRPWSLILTEKHRLLHKFTLHLCSEVM